jgi:hypothetical protein
VASLAASGVSWETTADHICDPLCFLLDVFVGVAVFANASSFAVPGL